MNKILNLGILMIGALALVGNSFAQAVPSPAAEVKASKSTPPPKEGNDLLNELKKDFKDRSNEYQVEQKKLLDNLKSAKGEQREKLREQLKALQETVKEEREKFKDQVKMANEKLRDLNDKLKEEVKDSRDKAKPRDR